MDETIFDSIPFQLNLGQLFKRTHIRDGSPYTEELMQIAAEAEPIARPKLCFLVTFIDEKKDYQIVVQGVTLTSRVLRVNMEKVNRIFPYIATCGIELEEWARGFTDPLYRYWAESIKELALFTALETFHKTLLQRYRIRRSSAMAPGSLEDWPIMQQANLFNLLGDLPTRIGVTLTDSLLMVPTKTVSGIRFPTVSTFESCQLCPRDNCNNRRAPYEPKLYAQKYEKAAAD